MYFALYEENTEDEKPFDKQIKTFNFMLVGNGAKVGKDGQIEPISKRLFTLFPTQHKTCNI
ncbi:hypothetical protein [Methanolobus sp.]|jgi:hypothetical protein|uniref:hypothetical protein n=1 Tax=Methanolobus sp. TaxID=1874737 RepID=UPI0025E09A23|nr:hypothetical protein [Methanolobus sp.]